MSEQRRLLGERYRVENSIGRGGMAQVYRGTDTVLNRTVAIKVLGPQYAQDQAFVERFRREAQAAARLNHPNVVSVYDTGSDGPVHYIVMEFVAGKTLAEVLSEGDHLTPERSAEIAAQVASALSFAHAAGIVHRDVKPGNIMITPSGEVKVMDFGIARAASAEPLTQTATVLGTASYLSPEQAQGEPVDARSDIYSLGIVLYEMLTGRPPFVADSAVAVAYKHVRESPTVPSTIVPGIPADLEAIVLKAMAKNPANRYATAGEMREDLERFLSGRPVLATPVMTGDESTMLFAGDAGAGTAVMTTPLPPEEEEPRRRVWLWVLIGVLIAAAVALLLYLLANSLIGSSPTKKVPKVVGQPLAAAVLQLQDDGFVVAPPIFKASAKPKNQVIKQDPEANAEVKEGSTVTLTVSGGQKQVAVPDLTGQTVQNATTTLTQNQLVIGNLIASEASDTIPKNHIIRQLPAAGTAVDVGTAVNYVLSTGPAAIAVPNETCKPFSQALNDLQAKGFVVHDGGTDPNGPNLQCPDPNLVSRTDPDAGSTAQKGDTVTIFRSDSLPPTTPPTTPVTTAPTTPVTTAPTTAPTTGPTTT
ncbi:MAG TPA: Stk1 family PASTA domain-containing Ser/Thr kinase [Actinomycetota bacterium]|nr:Stk1 family PASTA domain-containing Ser/Thr kinase [Actinomycetota bacterium]